MKKVLIFINQYWLITTAIILTAITTLSLLPVPQLPAVPGTDKTHHFIAYCALMLPAAIRKPKYYLLIGLCFIAWGGMIELIQPYVNRYGEWLDLAANATGVVLGLTLGLVIRGFSFNTLEKK
jgi:VanZ family protein